MIKHLSKKIFYVSIIVIGLCFWVKKTFFFKQNFFDRFAGSIAYPFLTTSSYINNKLYVIFEKKRQYKEIQIAYTNLELKYLNLIDEIIKLRASTKAYQEMEEVITFNKQYAITGIVAHIIARECTNTRHHFIINKGLRDGIKTDMVAVYKNNLIGKVADVSQYYSTIVLITDQYSKVAAYASETKAIGIVQGNNSRNICFFSYVSHLFPIKLNDLVLSSGQGLIFPEGFCLGRIIKHIQEPKMLYHTIEIAPIITLESIPYCTIIDYAQCNKTMATQA